VRATDARCSRLVLCCALPAQRNDQQFTHIHIVRCVDTRQRLLCGGHRAQHSQKSQEMAGASAHTRHHRTPVSSSAELCEAASPNQQLASFVSGVTSTDFRFQSEDPKGGCVGALDALQQRRRRIYDCPYHRLLLPISCARHAARLLLLQARRCCGTQALYSAFNNAVQ